MSAIINGRSEFGAFRDEENTDGYMWFAATNGTYAVFANLIYGD